MTKFFYFSLKSLTYLKTILVALGGDIKVLYFRGIAPIKLKLVLITFACFYTILLCLIYYFLFKSYQLTIEYINSNKIIELNKNIASLLSMAPPAHSFNDKTFKYYNPSLIKQVYNVHGITHYQEFIYPSLAQRPQKMVTFHEILESNPLVSSKFTGLVLQDMIRDHSEITVDVTYKLLKTVFKLSLPLGVSLLSLLGLYLLQGDTVQLTTQSFGV